MRTRTGWLAMLLTAGLALAPSTARAQIGGPPLDYTVPRADPVYPLPLFSDRPEEGGLFISGEFIFWRQSNPLENQVVAVRGLVDADGSITANLPTGVILQPPNHPIFAGPPVRIPGQFIGSARPALDVDDVSGQNSYVPGFRITVGYRFREGYTIEGSWAHLNNARYAAGASIVPFHFDVGFLLEDSFLFSPVYNFPPTYAGPANDVAVGNPLAAYGVWNAADEMTIKFEQRYDEWNIGGRVPICETECDRTYGLVGLRHVWIWERFKWRTVDYDFQGIAGPDDVAIFANIVSNAMYGPYIGCGHECYLGHGFSVSLDCNAALLIDFVREIGRWQRGDEATVAKRSRREYKFVPELEAMLNVWWYPIEGVQIRVGYDVKTFFNTVSSPTPIPFDFGAIDATWERQAFRLVDGLQAGIAFIF